LKGVPINSLGEEYASHTVQKVKQCAAMRVRTNNAKNLLDAWRYMTTRKKNDEGLKDVPIEFIRGRGVCVTDISIRKIKQMKYL
jgi:hypothetical protein